MLKPDEREGRRLSSDEVLDRWRPTELAYAQASHVERPQALFAKMAAEQAAIERSGVGPHAQAYSVRFGEAPDV